MSGEYQLQSGEPYWMEEVGLGIGRCFGVTSNDREGNRFLTPEELAKQERQEKASPVPQNYWC